MSNNSIDKLAQWVSSVLNIETKSKTNLEYLNSVLGPLKTDLSNYLDTNANNENNNQTTQIVEIGQTRENQDSTLNSLEGSFTHQIVFKIEENVYIEKINIYEKVCPGSSLLKIEALEKANPELWFMLWESENTNESEEHRRAKIFSPNILCTPFKTDTIKFTITGSLYLIDAIEIIGNKIAVETEKTKTQLKKSILSQNLSNLIQNDLFADVYFEVEGKIIAAHRNILVCRSEYFRAMLSSHGYFKESLKAQDPSKNPIYIKDIEYDTFLEILNYLYTGHVNSDNISFNLLIGVMKAADKMNLTQLDKLCLFHLSEIINQDNVISIYKEASECYEVMKNVIQMCYDVISINFSHVSRTEDFCSLRQDLMLKIIENVVPKLSRLTSSQINGDNQPESVQEEINREIVTLTDIETDTDTE